MKILMMRGGVIGIVGLLFLLLGSAAHAQQEQTPNTGPSLNASKNLDGSVSILDSDGNAQLQLFAIPASTLPTLCPPPTPTSLILDCSLVSPFVFRGRPSAGPSICICRIIEP
jgi:hypothetical protein